MNPVATSDAAFRGGACPTPEYTIAYTGNYTTSADANRLWRVSVFQGNLWDREETNRRTDLKAQSCRNHRNRTRSEEHTSELQSLMRISYAVFCLKKKKKKIQQNTS